MGEIVRLSAFNREKKGRHARSLDHMLRSVVALLQRDGPLPPSCKDQAMTGN